jgi:hypothetical protein
MNGGSASNAFFVILNQIEQDPEAKVVLLSAEKSMRDMGHAALSPVHVIMAVLSKDKPAGVSAQQWEAARALLNGQGITYAGARSFAENMGDGGYKSRRGADGIAPHFFDKEVTEVLRQLGRSREEYLQSASHKPFDPARPDWSWPVMLVRAVLTSNCPSVLALVKRSR